MKCKIFSAYYGEKDIIIENSVIKPIQCGSVYIDNPKIFLKDGIYPKISEKNESYNEISSLYAIWKDYSFNLEYIGFCHYRRYFITKKYVYIFFFLNKISNFFLKKYKLKIISKATNEIMESLSNYDAIFPKRIKLKISIKEHYKKFHIGKHYEIFEDIINSNFDFLAKYLDKASKQKYGYFFNMFILKKDIFYRYCENLFEFISLLELRIEIPEDTYQKRVVGFLSERFTNLYFEYLKNQNILIKEVKVLKIVI